MALPRSIAWFAAGLVAAAGCASLRAARERTQYLTTQLDGLSYSRSTEEVWAEVRRLLADKGYPLAGADAKAVSQGEGFLAGLFSRAKETRFEPVGGSSVVLPGLLPAPSQAAAADGPGIRYLETDWNRRGTRYRVDGSSDGKACRVTFTVIAEDTTEHGRDAARRRDVDMELELARRVDPEAAARIDAGLEALDAREGG